MDIRRATARHPVYTSLVFMAVVFAVMIILTISL